jgi:hypothetical protein
MPFEAHAASVSLMPLPLSITCTKAFPESCKMSFISDAPASTAFSKAPLPHWPAFV